MFESDHTNLEYRVDWPEFVPMRQEFDTRQITDLEHELVTGIRTRLAESQV